MAQGYFTQAGNFASAVQGGVDPRTGLFSPTLPLAHLVGNAKLGPSLPISLQYDPLSTDDMGLGLGMSLGFSIYDTDDSSKLLQLSTGERFKVIKVPDGVQLWQQKLDSVRFIQDDASNSYLVIHKSGAVEVLTGPKNNNRYKFPQKLYTPAGRALTLEWCTEIGDIPRLISIADETDTLLTINYDSPAAPVLTVWPGTEESHEFAFYIPESRTTSVTLSAGELSCSWDFGYDAACGAMNHVTSPTGRVQTVTYDPQGTCFPGGEDAPPPIPRVTTYTDDPGQGPATVRQYDYTDNNFVGFGQPGSPSPDDDFLYGVLTGYTYGSVVTTRCGADTRVIRYTYNNYHLLIRESVEQGSRTRCCETQYYAVPEQDFEHQPPQFQLAKSTTTTWSDPQASRQEVTTMDYDSAGNMTSRVTPDGASMAVVYYAADGEGDDCPADPHGFINYIKSETLLPGPPSEGGPNDAPTRKIEHKYKAVTTSTMPGVTHVVLRCQSTWTVNDAVLQTRTMSYEEDVDSANFSRVTSLKDDVYAADGSNRFRTELQKLAYSLAGPTLVQDVCWSCEADGLSASSQQRWSRFSGRLEGETDAASHTLDRTYDGFGRLLSLTECAGTPNQRQLSFTHEMWQHGEVAATLTDVWGNQIKRYNDGLGRYYRTDYVPAGSSDGGQTITNVTYDAWGRSTAVRHFDTIEQDGQSSSITARYGSSFDSWGAVNRRTDPNGSVSVHSYDPVAHVATISTEAVGLTLGTTAIAYDSASRPVSFTLYNSDGTLYSQQTMCYDGIGQLRTTTDALGHIVRHDYDVFGRLATVTYEDGKSICYTYADFTSKPLLAGVAIRPKGGVPLVLGTQTFDSLGRLASRTSSSGATTFEYDGAAVMPSCVCRAGDAIKHTYAQRPGWPMLSASAAGIDQSFQYDPATGALTQLTENGSATRTPHYAEDGTVSREEITYLDAGEARTSLADTQYSFSLCGRPNIFTDVVGNEIRHGYDGTGRLVSIDAQDVAISIQYDAAGRTSCWAVSDEAGVCMVTTIDYDDFGRETARKVFEYEGALQDACTAAASTGTEVQVINTTFDVMGRITEKNTFTADGARRHEEYEYDPIYGHLSQYQCLGSPAPCNDYGQVFTAEEYEYDCVGNVVKCTTTHDDGTYDTAEFFFTASDDPCRLTSVTHTHPAYPPIISFQDHYDAAGRLTQDQHGRSLTYDTLGRLVSAGECSYGYDASNTLILQSAGDQQRELYYCASLLVNERQRAQDNTAQLIRLRSALVAQRDTNGTQHLGTDMAGSVVLTRDPSGATDYPSYGPHGQQAPISAVTDTIANPGFNGERRDPAWGYYHLGNGYRAYNTALMRFTAPDEWSPFGAGGINAYSYCDGDSINYIDPTGHVRLSLFGHKFEMGVASLIGLGIATAFLVIGTPLFLWLSLGAATLAGTVIGLAGTALGAASDITAIDSYLTAGSYPHTAQNEAKAKTLSFISMGTGLAAAGEPTIGVIKGVRQAVTATPQIRPLLLHGTFAVGGTGASLYKAPPVKEKVRTVLHLPGDDDAPANGPTPSSAHHNQHAVASAVHVASAARPPAGHAHHNPGPSSAHASRPPAASTGEHTGSGAAGNERAAQRIEPFSLLGAPGSAHHAGLPPALAKATFCRALEAFVHEFCLYDGGSTVPGASAINQVYVRGPQPPLHKAGHDA